MPGPPPPPPPMLNAPGLGSGSGSGEQGRNMLLQSIRAGKPLKKTVTVDKSAPAFAGQVKGELSNTSSAGNNSSGTTSSSVNNNSNGGPVGLGGLFSGGMPKLKPTGLRKNKPERDNGSSVSNTSSSVGNASNAANLSGKRGPPPIPPPATQKPLMFPQGQSTTDSATSISEPSKSFGKPTIAPKPPPPPSPAPQKPSPPPKKLNLMNTGGASVSRAQSMRLPRSPQILAPPPPSLHQSQDCLNEPPPRLASRLVRPPIARPPPPPPYRVAVSAPSMPPPPPPPPHRSASSHQRLAPPPPPPPTPPTRISSMRNGQSTTWVDLEARFSDMFHSIMNFPPPDQFRGFTKTYNSRNAAKQQAPPPPPPATSNSSTKLHLNAISGGKQWQHSAASSAC